MKMKMRMNTLQLNNQKFKSKNKNITTYDTFGKESKRRRRWVNFKRQQELFKMENSM
jgi:hypothetical protein